MVTNVTNKASSETTSTSTCNKENEPSTSGTSGTSGGSDVDNTGAEGHNADNYDARQARKRSTKKRKQVDAFQERLLKAIEVPQPHVVEQIPQPKHEYLDAAFKAMAFKMKEVLSKDEIMDLVEDLEQLVNRACREKRRRMEMVTNPLVPPQHPLTEQMYSAHKDPWQCKCHLVATMTTMITTISLKVHKIWVFIDASVCCPAKVQLLLQS